MSWREPHPFEYVRLRCENPKCKLFYLAHSYEPIFFCFTCQDHRKIIPSNQNNYPLSFNPVIVFNRYDCTIAEFK